MTPDQMRGLAEWAETRQSFYDGPETRDTLPVIALALREAADRIEELEQCCDKLEAFAEEWRLKAQTGRALT